MRLVGRAAAPGFALGPLHRIADVVAGVRAQGTPETEARALHEAIAAAIARLAALIGAADGAAAEMLGFQVAMLDDPVLAAPAFAAIAAGAAAETAWVEALDAEIVGYEGADDAYFRARAADLRDLRDAVLAALLGASGAPPAPAGAVLVGVDLTPSGFLGRDWTQGGGIALAAGSPASHVAMLARARGVPMVVGLGVMPDAPVGTPLLVDGDAGVVVVAPDAGLVAERTAAAAARAATQANERSHAARLAVTADGVPVRVLVNLGHPDEVARIDPAWCEGVGLVRTEFLFHGGGLPDEATQYAAYRRILDWAAGRPVTLRTVDAGGDKPVPGLTIDGESNPFLGVRGIRLSLARPEVLVTQLRALARVAALGPVRVMLPMVSIPAELDAARALLDDAVAALRQGGVACARPALGMMVEVPAAALGAARFDAEFYSIGSNDLTQYVMAAARDLPGVAALNDPTDPAVLELIARTVAVGTARGVEVSLCGDAAGEPALLPALLGTGLRTLSMAPGAIPRVKAAIAAQRVARG